MSFKIGDRVRYVRLPKFQILAAFGPDVTNKSTIEEHIKYLGNEGYIVEVNEAHSGHPEKYAVDGPMELPKHAWYDADELELVKKGA